MEIIDHHHHHHHIYEMFQCSMLNIEHLFHCSDRLLETWALPELYSHGIVRQGLTLISYIRHFCSLACLLRSYQRNSTTKISFHWSLSYLDKTGKSFILGEMMKYSSGNICLHLFLLKAAITLHYTGCKKSGYSDGLCGGGLMFA